MPTDPAVRDCARAFAAGDLSPMALYEWLAGRASPIEDDLEAALWGLVIEVDSGETTLDQARSWVAEQLDLDAAAA